MQLIATRPVGAAVAPDLRLTRAAVPAPPLAATPTRSVVSADELVALAQRTRTPARTFPVGGHLAEATNAHYANTVRQVRYALEHDYNSLEGDVRVRGGVLVMAHDKGRVPDLTLDEWLRIGAAGERMLRIDVKESEALAGVLDAIDRAGVPHGRVTLNLTVDQPWLGASVPLDEARAARSRLPEAWMTFNVPVPMRIGYDRAIRVAEAVGGRTGIAVMANLVDEDLVRYLTPRIVMNVWNLPMLWEPRDVAAATRRLRALGVNGMIDLRRSDDPLADD